MAQNVATSLSCRLYISSNLPDDFPGCRIIEHPICTYSFPFGQLTIQEIESEDYSLYYHVIRSSEAFPYSVSLNPQQLTAIFILEGSFGIVPDEREESLLQKSQWKLLKPSKELRLESRTTGVLELILISFGGGLSEEMGGLFPLLQAVRDGSEEIDNRSPYLPLETRDYLQGILHCKYESEWRKHFIDNRIGDILFSILVSCSGSNPFQDISQEDLEKIHQAERIITTDITRYKRLNTLAEEIGMSRTKFKQLFKKVYGQTAAEYQRKIRLSLSVKYLNNGHSVKESAFKAGWRPPVFIEAFKEIYHTTPGKYVKLRDKGC